MYKPLTDRVGVFTGSVNIGVVRCNDDRVVLIDTGANEGNARKLLRCIRDELQSDVAAILSTHGHADHFGGHGFVVKRTGATVYAPALESSVLQHPELQPIFMFGGAAPPAALRERFVLAQASPVHHVIQLGQATIQGVEVEVISLGGHSPNQVGYIIDDIFFCADVVFPRAAIVKYRIPYLFDLGQHLLSMEAARNTTSRWIVPGHGPVEEDFEALYRINCAIVYETLEEVRRCLESPMSLERLAEQILENMDVPMAGHVSYYLLRPTLAAYLTYLEQLGEVDHLMLGKTAVWHLR